MRCHWIRWRATAHATEDLDKVLHAVHHVTGLDEERFASSLTVTDIESHHGATVHLIDVELSNQRPMRDALAHMVPSADGLLEESGARTDTDGVFYLRFDKQAALEGRLARTRSEDAVQVRVKPEVHPAGRERALDALRAWLAGLP